jgi:hypothetical protein
LAPVESPELASDDESLEGAEVIVGAAVATSTVAVAAA